jgi:hypothetical protein
LPQGRAGEALENPKKQCSFRNGGELDDKNTTFFVKLVSIARGIAQAVSFRPDTAEVRVPSQAIPYEIYGVHSSIGTGFSLGTSIFRCQ